MQVLIAITSLGIFCLVAEIFNLRKIMVPVSVLGLLAILGLTLNFWSFFDAVDTQYISMIASTDFSKAFISLFIILTIFILVMSEEFYKEHPTKFSDFIAIKLFLLAGAVAMVSFTNLSMFFLGLEILSVALYVLAASNRQNVRSNEAGMKYFLMGAFASGIILFGICLIYGATGYFDMVEIQALSQGVGLPVWFPIGIALMVIGMLFKVAAVPFHFWAPDVYEGSPTMTTTTMSTLVKVVAMASLFKLLDGLLTTISPKVQILIVVISILSMTFGNIMALRQKNVKRMLAFSGISHAGFMLMALLTMPTAAENLLYYAFAYALAGIAAFAVIIHVTTDNENELIEKFNGLGKTNPLMAAVLTGALLSMAGIPIFSGFFAKFMLFTDTIQTGFIVVVIAAVINSIISIGYYFKLILAMYTKGETAEKHSSSLLYTIVAVLAISINIIIGIYPSLVLNLL